MERRKTGSKTKRKIKGMIRALKKSYFVKINQTESSGSMLTNGEREGFIRLQKMLDGRDFGEVTFQLYGDTIQSDRALLKIATQGGALPALTYRKELHELDLHPSFVGYVILDYLCKMIADYEQQLL